MTAPVPAEPIRLARDNEPPHCRCGAPSVWIGGFGRACEPCLPVRPAGWLAWGRLSQAITERFGKASERVGRTA